MRMTDVGKLDYTAGERRLVATSAVLGYGLDFYNLIVLAFLMPVIQKDLEITGPQVGLIVSMTLAGSVLGGILFGWMGDRWGRKNALMFTLVLLSGGAILSACAWNFISLLAFRFIAGIGVGGEWGAGMVLFNEVWDRNRRGFGSAIVQAASSIGLILAALVATWTLSSFGPNMSWRIALLVGALPIILMFAVRRGMPESRLWSEFKALDAAGKLPEEKKRERSPLIEIMTGPSLKYFVFGTIVAGGYIINYQSISVFMPGLMIRGLGASQGNLLGVTLVTAVIAAAGMLVTGWLSDTWGRKKAIIATTLVGVCGVLAIYAAGGTKFPGDIFSWSMLWAFALWSLGQGSIGQFGPWFAELYPVELRSTAASTIFTMGRLVGAIAPYLVPVLAETMGLLNGMMLALVGSAISLLFTLTLPETAGRRFDVIEGKDVADKVASAA
jgi:MFS family permease